MKIIIGRQNGKTTELIRLCAENGGYIVCRSGRAAEMIQKQAKEMGLNIPFPLTHTEFIQGSFYGRGVKKIYIDDAEEILRRLARGTTLEAFTISYQEKEETPVCEYCKTPGKYLDVIDAEDRVFVGLAGECIQIFNESYPGYIHNIKIKYCPICGRKLE